MEPRAILGSAGSGVRAAEGARLEIAWAGLTRLEGSNPSHSVSRAPGRGAPLAFRGVPGRIAQRESARFTRGRSLVQSQVRPSPAVPVPIPFAASASGSAREPDRRSRHTRRGTRLANRVLSVLIRSVLQLVDHGRTNLAEIDGLTTGVVCGDCAAGERACSPAAGAGGQSLSSWWLSWWVGWK
jgi:hypothetical protein